MLLKVSNLASMFDNVNDGKKNYVVYTWENGNWTSADVCSAFLDADTIANSYKQRGIPARVIEH